MTALSSLLQSTMKMTAARAWGLVLLALVLAFSLQASAAFAQTESSICGPIENAYGPFDYRTTEKAKLTIVTDHHFTPVVEELIRGATGSRPGGDLDYTLRAIPNHPRALMSMLRLGEKEKTPQPSGSRYTVECWFDRALRFQQNDNVVRMIFSTFLAKNGRKPEAMQQLERVVATAEDNPFTNYNAGLIYFDMGEYANALQQAHKAIALGFPRTELRDKLQSVGRWEEPRVASVSEPAEPASAPQKP